MAEPSATPEELRRQAANYIAELLEICQLRGAFTLQETDSLLNAVKRLKAFSETPESNDLHTDSTIDLETAWSIAWERITISQERGRLTLREAWSIYNAMKLFKKDETDDMSMKSQNDDNTLNQVGTVFNNVRA